MGQVCAKGGHFWYEKAAAWIILLHSVPITKRYNSKSRVGSPKKRFSNYLSAAECL
jgi:hypothetical protein